MQHFIEIKKDIFKKSLTNILAGTSVPAYMKVLNQACLVNSLNFSPSILKSVNWYVGVSKETAVKIYEVSLDKISRVSQKIFL